MIMTDINTPSVILVLGGARSGKTAYAEATALAMAGSTKPFYLATGQAFDDEMQRRIDRHREIRADRFDTLEEPHDIAHLIQGLAPDRVMLIDSIGTWITNLMMQEEDMDTVFTSTVNAVQQSAGHVVIVSDEIGLGIVPENAMAREFRDHIGMFNQKVADLANRVVLVVAGQPLIIKDM